MEQDSMNVVRAVGNFPYSSSISNCREIFNMRVRWHTGPTAYRPHPMDYTFSPVSQPESKVQRLPGEKPMHLDAVWI